LIGNDNSQSKERGKMAVQIGFLGGGQLARMMVLEAHRLGLQPHVYSASKDDPAAQVTSHHTAGKLDNINKLRAFAQKMDYLTFESEFVPPEVLLELDKKMKTPIFPKPSIMRTLQNRLTQKETLQKFRIPTSPFVEANDFQDLQAAWNTFQGPFVLKTNFGGYDGYGTFFARKIQDLKSLEEKLHTSPQGCLAEKFIPFKREVAAMFVRSSSGETQVLPLVETFQTSGRCDWVRGPISHPKWPSLQKRILKMMTTLKYVGCLGVEMFDTGSELWVNELAPRVHNSGHYSQDALIESQFTLHIKAGLGLKLPKAQILSPQFVMTNLLGLTNKELQAPSNLTGELHLYGKSENRPGRKMGHVNYLGAKGPDLLKKALKERKGFQL
jgi:5-(carboxyamino)imidazole ribonucleotide synthase